jgi:MFS family permease
MAVASPLSGRMLDTVGAKPVVLSGVALMIVGLTILGIWPTSLIWFYTFSVLFGFGIAVLLGAALRYMMLAEASESERAPAQAMLTITISVGQMIGATMMATVAARGADSTSGYALAMLVTAAVMALVLVIGFGIRRRVTRIA